MILLDYRDKRPIYEQMVEKLEHLIVSGGLEPLTKMPSVRSLAMELSVNPNTVQRAYAQLEQEGYLYTVSGRGSFVTAQEEWRESRQERVWQSWNGITRQARDAGIAGERLLSGIQQIYGADLGMSDADSARERVGDGRNVSGAAADDMDVSGAADGVTCVSGVMDDGRKGTEAAALAAPMIAARRAGDD